MWISTRSLTSTTTKLCQRRKQKLQGAGKAHLPRDTRGDASQAAEVYRGPELRVAAGSAARGAATWKTASGARCYMRWLTRHRAARLPPPPSPALQLLPRPLRTAPRWTTGHARGSFQLQTSPAALLPRALRQRKTSAQLCTRLSEPPGHQRLRCSRSSRSLNQQKLRHRKRTHRDGGLRFSGPDPRPDDTYVRRTARKKMTSHVPAKANLRAPSRRCLVLRV